MEIKTKDYMAISPTINAIINEYINFNFGSDILQSGEAILALYRTYGHQAANLDPLGLSNKNPAWREMLYRKIAPYLESEIDAAKARSYIQEFSTRKPITIREYISVLESIYCSSIGYDIMHLPLHKREWLLSRIEQYSGASASTLLHDVERLRALDRLIESTALETSLSNRFPGMKRFALNGVDTFIPLVDRLILSSMTYGMRQCVLAMAHRGRIATYRAIMNMPYDMLYGEFLGKNTFNEYYNLKIGDRKYHMPYESSLAVADVNLSLQILGNPSHLESIDPVALGVTRGLNSKIRPYTEENRGDISENAMAIIVHGDSAFSGQGVVQESLQLSNTKACSVGGSIHVIINNQIGFTTEGKDNRSSYYCSDIAKMTCPIFHVNYRDVDAALYIAKIAAEYRSAFNEDCVIDLIGYREYGHNEGDDPSFTQPIMYKAVKNLKASPIDVEYSERLINDGILTLEAVNLRKKEIGDEMDNGYNKAASENYSFTDKSATLSEYDICKYEDCDIVYGIQQDKIEIFAKALNKIPEAFNISDKLSKILERRMASINEDKIDWATAESLAFASILDSGTSIRMSGQDSQRGTFSQRHSVWHDQNVIDVSYTPLQNIPETTSGLKRGNFEIYNSVLSEYAVSGFEFGYAYTKHRDMVIWEAQFGDFANTAQVIIDQYIAGAGARWNNYSKLTLLLPHGYEGEAAEHSSGRIERFLQLASDCNMIVCNCTTPDSYFHLLRRQALSKLGAPLIIFTPKSLLRNKAAISSKKSMDENHSFRPIIGGSSEELAKCDRIVLCSGKIFYDIEEKISEVNKRDKIGVIRLEQLYPLDEKALIALLDGFRNRHKSKCDNGSGVGKIIWCQEEPMNMGAYHFIQGALLKYGIVLDYAGRKSSPVTACALPSMHNAEQSELLNNAVGV